MSTNEERIQITKALQQWAKQAPRSELVIDLFGGARSLTALQVYIEVEKILLTGRPS